MALTKPIIVKELEKKIKEAENKATDYIKIHKYETQVS